MTDNQTFDVAYMVNQQTKPLSAKIDALKENFGTYSEKLDFIKKSDGYNYVLGRLGLNEDFEYRIWKTYDAVSKSRDVEYLFEGNDLEEAKQEFKNIISK